VSTAPQFTENIVRVTTGKIGRASFEVLLYYGRSLTAGRSWENTMYGNHCSSWRSKSRANSEQKSERRENDLHIEGKDRQVLNAPGKMLKRRI
jgi:hypothetical protein